MEEMPKVKVTMTNDRIENGIGWHFEAVDYVPQNELDDYVADAKERWDSIVLSNN